MGVTITLMGGEPWKRGRRLVTIRQFQAALAELACIGFEEVKVAGELLDDDRRWNGVLDIRAAQAALTIGEY